MPTILSSSSAASASKRSQRHPLPSAVSGLPGFWPGGTPKAGAVTVWHHSPACLLLSSNGRYCMHSSVEVTCKDDGGDDRRQLAGHSQPQHSPHRASEAQPRKLPDELQHDSLLSLVMHQQRRVQHQLPCWSTQGERHNRCNLGSRFSRCLLGQMLT